MKRLFCLIVLLAIAVQGWAADPAQQPLRIGSKRFTESYILAQLMSQTVAAATGTAPEVRQGLGNTAIVYEALRSGNIDMYPEYAGTIALEILKLSGTTSLAEMNQALAPLGLGAALPLGFNNGYALALRAADAQRLKLRTLSDLARHPELKLGLSNEFIGRADGWAGLRARYALPFGTPRGIEHGLKFGALAAGQLDVIDVYSTDAAIARHGLRVLEDDRGYFPRYDAVLLYRVGLEQRLPRTHAALAALEGRFDDATMRSLNARAEVGSEPFDAIAARFVGSLTPGPGAPSPAAATAGSAATGAPAIASVRRGFVDVLFGEDFLRLTAEHVALVFVSLLLSVSVGVPLGIWCAGSARARRWVLPAVGLVQTVPSLALLALLITLFGRIGLVPALTALFLYGLLPIVHNTCAGLEAIAQPLRDSARALGLPRTARLLRIELPLALGAIMAGVQTSAVINVGTATIAAFIGAGGYGERIATGLALNDGTLLLAGALPAAVLALAVQGLFSVLERRLVAPPLRGRSATARHT